MQIRRRDENGDMTFGNGSFCYLKDSPEAVGILCSDRLHLWQGEWFLDSGSGTDWRGRCLGNHTLDAAIMELRRVISGTQGITGITAMDASRDGGRAVSVTVQCTTEYGSITVQAEG